MEPEFGAATGSVPDMRGQGQPACLVTARKNEEGNPLFICVYSICKVPCAHNVLYVIVGKLVCVIVGMAWNGQISNRNWGKPIPGSQAQRVGGW